MSGNSFEEKDQEKSQGFKVADRRKFSAEGELLNKQPSRSEPGDKPKGQEKVQPESNVRSQADSKGKDDASRGRTCIDFSSFVLSLATSVLVNLGEVPDPTTGKRSENLPAAQQTLDILCMLEEKTKGNLEEDEAQFMENVLYELRMKFLAKAKIINV